MKDLEKKIQKHLKDRGWDNLRPVDISKSIMIEGAELLELFQWNNLSLDEILKDKERIEKIKGELADILIYSIEMAVLLKLDTEKIIKKKLVHVGKKYPAKLMRAMKKDPKLENKYWEIKKEYRKKEN